MPQPARSAMPQLIGLTLGLALTLVVMVAPAVAQQASQPSGTGNTTTLTANPSQLLAPVAVPNFISYRDRARVVSPESDDAAELFDGDDPTGVTSDAQVE